MAFMSPCLSGQPLAVFAFKVRTGWTQGLVSLAHVEPPSSDKVTVKRVFNSFYTCDVKACKVNTVDKR